MRFPLACFILLSIAVTGCATKTPPPPADHSEAKGVLWQADNTNREYEAEQICESVVLPVSPTHLDRAITMLGSTSFVRLSTSQAEELIGHSFSARTATLKEAEYHADRSAFFTEQIQRYFDDSSAREAITEHRETARRLRSQARHLRPYLIRAIGLRGCGTGRFFAHRQNNEIWISFGGLGGGFSPETQAVVVYLDREPSDIHLSDPSTCL